MWRSPCSPESVCFRIPLVGSTVVGPAACRLCSVCLRYDQGHQPSNSLSWGGDVTPGFPGTELKAWAAGTQAEFLQNVVETLWWEMAGLRPFQQRTKGWGWGPKRRAWGHAESEQQRPTLNAAAFQTRLVFSLHPAVFLVKWLPCFKNQRGLLCWSVPLRVQLSACSCCSNCCTEISPETGKNVSLG